MASSTQKFRAYEDAVEITKAAYSSPTSYSSDRIDDFLQKVYDKLVELIDDSNNES